MTQYHSPLPWRLDDSRTTSGYDIYQESSRRLIANCGGWQDSHNPNQDAEKRANAAFIAHACNVHEELLAALAVGERFMAAWLADNSMDAWPLGKYEAIEMTHAAIVKAKGGSATT